MNMRYVNLNRKKRITIDGIIGYMERSVTKFGTGAKVDCPKEYLGKKVYLVITET
jgi:putative transposon-encoded protein